MSKYIIGSKLQKPIADNESGSVLFTVHRRGLVDNASKSFNEEPAVEHGIIMSGRKPDWSQRVHVGSIDTMRAWYAGETYNSSHTFDLVVFDECVSGDSVLKTDIGPVLIKDLPNSGAKSVLSYDGQNVVMSEVLNWKHSGKKKTLVFHTHLGKIRCTENHPIYTRRGWLQAKDVLPTDELLVCADVQENRGMDGCTAGVIAETLTNQKVENIGSICTALHRYVNVDAGSRLILSMLRLMRGLNLDITRISETTFQAMLSALSINQSNYLGRKGRQYSEHCLAIHQSDIHTAIRLFQEYILHTDLFKNSGLNTKPNTCRDLKYEHELSQAKATASSQYALLQSVFRCLKIFTKQPTKTAGKPFPKDGLNQLETLGLRGGFATMVQQAVKVCFSTQRDIRNQKTKSLPTGFVKTSGRQQSFKTSRKNFSLSAFPLGHKSNLEKSLPHTFQNVCDTNWTQLISIEQGKVEDVYDIEVEKTHCFFANNHLVHNCHSHLGKLRTWFDSHNDKREQLGLKPAYLLGLSATPSCRGLGDVFRDIVKGPSKEWLIEQGYLSPFRYVQATQGKTGLLVKRAGEFTEESIDACMEGLAGDLVGDWLKFGKGRPTVGFFHRLSNAQEACNLLRSRGIHAEYLDGATSDEQRNHLFSSLNCGDLEYLCNVGIVERGTDIPGIACVQLCTAIGSRVRFEQMIGRGSRRANGKIDCIVIDHAGNIKRHGFFEDEIDWTLDTERNAVKDFEARPSIHCPSCDRVYRGGACVCGYEPTPKERKAQGLEFDGRELVEISRKPKAETVKKKTCEQILIESLYRAGKTGRTWKQAIGIALRECQKQGTKFRNPGTITVGGKTYRTLPYGHPDGARRVEVLFPFTVNGEVFVT